MSKHTQAYNELVYKKQLLIEAQAELNHIEDQFKRMDDGHQLLFKPEMTRVRSWVHALSQEVDDLKSQVGTDAGSVTDDVPMIPKSPMAFPSSVMSVLAPKPHGSRTQTDEAPVFPDSTPKVSGEPYYIAIVQNAKRQPEQTESPEPDYVFVGVSADNNLFVYEHRVGEPIPQTVQYALRFDLNRIRDLSPWYLPFSLPEKEVL